MQNFIIGTAGHIDHGKTTLIKALTGRSTDTLQEEIKRGISINLGFTYFDLPSGQRAGIIDVPGHERFIKNMIAGASGIDLVLFTVAANEGIKPQTLEHFDILSFLNLKEAIIVLTKCSIADSDMKLLVADDLRELSKGSFLEKAKIIEIDSISGLGMNELVAEIDCCAKRIQERSNSGSARLNIDRVFSMKGFGTIVTGTLMDGKISIGDELFVYPKELPAKVRNIQVHEANTQTAYSGQRAAINISNIKMTELNRGDVLAKHGSMTPSRLVDVKINLLKSFQRQLKLWDRVRVYIGSKELFARLVPLNNTRLSGGDRDCLCQLRFESDVCSKKGDPFVLRFYSPLETIGGGVILDPNAKKHSRFNADALESLSIKDSGEHEDMISDFVKGKGYLPQNSLQISQFSNLPDTEEHIQKLEQEGVLIKLETGYLHCDILNELTDATLLLLSDFHKKNPLKSGVQKEELKQKLKTSLKFKDFEVFLRQLENKLINKLINIDGSVVSLANFEVVLSNEQKNAKAKMEKALIMAGFAFLTVDELVKSKTDKEIAEAYPAVFVKLAGTHVIHRDLLEKAKNLVADEIKTNGSITVKDFRDKIDTSRKYAMMILEEFDRIKLTVRVDDCRKLL